MSEKLLSESVIQDLNQKIQEEEFNSRLYKYMHLWLKNKNYTNLSILYRGYAKEERQHAKWSTDFLLDFGILPELKALPSPVVEYETCMDILDMSMEQEVKLLKKYEELGSKALQEKNINLYDLALKYCKEQKEEIAKIQSLIDLKSLTEDLLVFDDYVGRYILNNEARPISN